MRWISISCFCWHGLDGNCRCRVNLGLFWTRRGVITSILITLSQVNKTIWTKTARGIFVVMQEYTFFRNVISTWSSGTGGAGIFGSFSYAALISLGVSSVNTMLLMLSVPLIEGAAFWLLLRKPCNITKRNADTEFNSAADQETGVENKQMTMSLGDKIRYMPSLLKYMVPLGLVYLFEYFINQGLVCITNHTI